MISIAQEIRGAVERIVVLGGSGVLLLCTWLVTQDKGQIENSGRILISLGIVMLAAMFASIVRTFNSRYRGVAQVIRKLNEVQGVYEPGTFLRDENLFPEQFKDYGSPKWREPIFRVSYISLVLVAAFGVATVWIIT